MRAKPVSKSSTRTRNVRLRQSGHTPPRTKPRRHVVAATPQEGFMSIERKRPSAQDLEAEAGTILPAKEVMSVPLLDLNIDVDLALALAAPIDLAVAGNLNVALPIDAPCPPTCSRSSRSRP